MADLRGPEVATGNFNVVEQIVEDFGGTLTDMTAKAGRYVIENRLNGIAVGIAYTSAT